MNYKYSIIIPTLDEENFITKCIESLFSKNQSIFSCEIIIIDGKSKDGTLEKIKILQKKYPNIFIYINEKQITPCALNIGIKASQGKYIIRLDAHAEYCDGYIDKTINFLENSDKNIMNVGGIIKTHSSKKNLISDTIALVLSSKFGVGNSFFRTSNSEKRIFVETVPFGGFKKEIFEIVGLFNEDEPRNEDLELNDRIIKAGYKIVLIPELESIYYSRSTFKSFFYQAFDNGFIVTRKIGTRKIFHKDRHFIPMLFNIFLITLISFYFIADDTYIFKFFLSILFLYIFLNLIFSTINTYNNKNLFYLISMPLVYFVLHFSYGLGSIFGLFTAIKLKLKKGIMPQ